MGDGDDVSFAVCLVMYFTNMITLLIWLGWIGFGITIYFVLPHIRLPQHITLGSNKILRIQTTLFVKAWVGKFFAGGLYFANGKQHAIAMAIVAIAELFTVFILGCIFRKYPSRTEQIEELKKKLAELGVDPSDLVDQNTNSHKCSPEVVPQPTLTLSLYELENRIRARRGA